MPHDLLASSPSLVGDVPDGVANGDCSDADGAQLTTEDSAAK